MRGPLARHVQLHTAFGRSLKTVGLTEADHVASTPALCRGTDRGICEER